MRSRVNKIDGAFGTFPFVLWWDDDKDLRRAEKLRRT